MQKECWNNKEGLYFSHRKAQITVFIIVGIIIVVVALILLIYPSFKSGFSQEINPAEYIKSCTESAVKKSVEIAGKQGGSVHPQHTVSFQGENIEYLCYTNAYYKTCVMQQPLLKQHLEYELVNDIKPKIEDCVQSLQGELEKRGFTVAKQRPDVTLSIIPKTIDVNVKLGLKVTKGETSTYDTVTVQVPSSLYDLAMVSESILNFEARYGDADPLGYMFYYPDLKVQKLKQDDGTKIYILHNRNSGEEFQFASRSLSWPAGYIGTDNLALYPGRV